MNKKGTKNSVRNSFGVYDVYKLIRKNGWYNIGRPMKEHEFYTIIRSIHKLLAEEILRGNVAKFPAQMGSLELRKYPKGVSIVNGKLKNTYPIDWSSTLKLWAEDEEAKQKNILLRYESPMVYKVRYCKEGANYENKIFYRFRLMQSLKKRLKEDILTGKTDTLW